jgi:hypothetical protein
MGLRGKWVGDIREACQRHVGRAEGPGVRGIKPDKGGLSRIK